MAAKNSLFVDTSGWAYLVDRHDPLHRDVHTAYQQALTQQRLLVTTNYVIAELVPLLASRSRIPRQQIFAFVDALKSASHVEIIHIDASLDTEAWALLKARSDKDWSLVDASSFVIMTTYGMTEALTTDHHFTLHTSHKLDLLAFLLHSGSLFVPFQTLLPLRSNPR